METSGNRASNWRQETKCKHLPQVFVEKILLKLGIDQKYVKEPLAKLRKRWNKQN